MLQVEHFTAFINDINFIELVLNNFINTRVNTKSRDRLSDMFIGHVYGFVCMVLLCARSIS